METINGSMRVKLTQPYTNSELYLDPRILKTLPLFKADVKKAGINLRITQTGRLKQYQQCLYLQGRSTLFNVNKARKVLSLPDITEELNRVVTWTLNSKHIIDPISSNPIYWLSRAFDFAILNGKAIATDRSDLDKDGVPDYKEVGLIGEKYGYRWGGHFKSPDFGHLEVI